MGGGYCLVCNLWLSMRDPGGWAGRHYPAVFTLPATSQREMQFVKLVRQLYSLFRHRCKNQSIHAGSILEVIECTLNTISREELYAGGPSGHSTLQGRTLLYNSKC